MTDAQDGFERWTELLDRQAVGDAMSADEQAFCKRFVSEHPECAHELELYDELADLSAHPTAASRTLVDAALKRMEAEEAHGAIAEASSFRKRGVPIWTLATSLLAVAAMLALYLRDSGKHEDEELRTAQNMPLARAELVYASGHVSVSGTAATVGRTLLAEGSVIETGDGAACVLIDPEINVCLAAQSRLRLSRITSSARRLDLLAGKASTRLAAQPDGMSLSIMADGVTSTAVGTAFSVERDAQGSVVTTVLNGKVRVGRDGQAQIVSAHERLVVSETAAHGTDVPGLRSVSRSEEAPSWALLGPTVLWHDPVSATLDVHGEPLQAEALLDDQPIGMAPLSSLIPVGNHHLVVRSRGVILAERDLHMTAGDIEVVTYTFTQPALQADGKSDARLDAHPEVRAAHAVVQGHASERADANAKLLGQEDLAAAPLPEPNPETTSKSAGAWLSEARKSMREGRYADAAGIYATIMREYPSSEEAHTVLVSLGQVQLVQLNQPQQAIASLDAYLTQGGSLSEEARVTRIRALRALHREADEASAIDEFLAKHPRSFEAAELRQRLSDLRQAK